MAFYPPRPRPQGKPKGIARRVREANPLATQESSEKVARNIHERLRKQKEASK